MSKKRKVPEHIKTKRKIEELLLKLEKNKDEYCGIKGEDKLLTKQLEIEIKELKINNSMYFI